MKIGVLGAGAIGCYLGGKLIAAGHEVVLVGRLGDEIRESGLKLTDFAGDRVELAGHQVSYVGEPAPLAEVDAVFVTVKSLATEDAARPLASILTRSTPIVRFQNGVSNVSRPRSMLPGHPILAGMVPFNVARTAPGHFHNGTSGGPAAAACRSDVDDSGRSPRGAAHSSSAMMLAMISSSVGRFVHSFTRAGWRVQPIPIP